VLAARALDGVPPGGVTSVKLSGSGRLVLLGYGVRDRPYASYGGGDDAGPPHPVLDVFDAGRGLAPLATVRTREDEDVNIARFHPCSAQGFLYGTKQGRLRVFMPGGRRSRGAGLVDVDEVDENEDGDDG
jgi:activator-of-BECN1-regulated-autophagy protein 1